MKGCGETANHTRKPPAKYRVNIFQKYIYREKFDGRQATIAKWAFSDVVENQTNRTKIKNDACRLFRVGREKLLFLTQKRVEKEGCTRVENGTKSGRKGVGKVTKDGREGMMEASQVRLATGTIASAKPMTTEKKKADTEGSHKKPPHSHEQDGR